jgi:hypothetical protein
MTRWEYAQIRVAGRVIWWYGYGEHRRLDGFDPIEHLNIAGRDGWELVGVTEVAVEQTVVTKYVLKRAIA